MRSTELSTMSSIQPQTDENGGQGGHGDGKEGDARGGGGSGVSARGAGGAGAGAAGGTAGASDAGGTAGAGSAGGIAGAGSAGGTAGGAGAGSPERGDGSIVLLKWGTIISGLLGFASLVGAFTLSIFVVTGSDAQQLGAVNLRLLLSCVACFIAMGFASIGFGLFLIRAEGVFRAAGGSEGPGSSTKLGIATTAPGLVVMVCATIVLWRALDTPFKRVEENGPASGAPATASGSRAAEEKRDPSGPERELPGGMPPPPGSYSLDPPDAAVSDGSAPPQENPSAPGVGE
jgi:hypothetical protein